MNHGWEKKRLGEVCQINFGKRIVAKDTPPGPYYVYGGGGATFTTMDYNRENCMIVSRFAMSPECVRFVRGRFFLNDSGLSVQSNNGLLTQEFVEKYLWAIQPQIYNLGRGAAQKNLNTKSFSEMPIPIPAVEVQRQIVSELDKINEMLEVKRGQLKDLDMLSQSLFYEMFGDPIENPQGWETFHLRDLVKEKLSYGSGASGIPYDNKIRYIRITDIDERGNLKPEIASSPSEYNSKYMLKHGDILLARSGATVGKAFLYKKSIGPAIYAGYLIKVSIDMSILNSIYLYEFTKTAYYWNYISKSIRGAAQPNVNAQLYGNLSIPVPPLSLQNEFASKIEAIEEQKRVIESTISDLEVLLASRMDYWFND